MSESLRNLSTIEYGASPKEIRSNDSTAIGIYGTGGLVGSAIKPLFHGPLVVVARKGTLDKPLFITGDCWVIDTAYAVLPNANVDAKWLYYNLLKYDLKKLNESTGVPSISRDYLYRVTFETYPLAEQRKIARILSTVDAVIEKTEATIAKYKAIKSGMMRDLFSRGIDLKTVKLRPRYEDAPELYKQSELGWVPKEWDIVRMDEILKSPVRDFGSFAMTNLITFEESGVIFIKSEMVQDGYIDFSRPYYINDEVHKLLFKSMVFSGDILFTKIGAIGRVATYDGRLGVCNSNAATAKIQVDKSRCDPDYIAYKLTSTRVINEFNKSVISTPPRINLGDINSLNIKLPKKYEQIDISNMIKSIINKTQLESLSLAKYQQLKTALMSDLLTGKVRVIYEEEKLEVI